MTPDAYHAFTRALLERITADPRALGLVALGSMAERGTVPDEWSDHDFFVIVPSGEQEHWRNDLSWLPRLPELAEIVLAFRETAHGLKVLYASGHLLEFTVFDPDELYLARINRYRVLLDRADIGRRLAEIADTTTREQSAVADDPWLVGNFLTNLFVGMARYHRGERMSGWNFVVAQALRHLVVLFHKHLPGGDREILDNLDPLRRIELAWPELGRELDQILQRGMPACALGLLLLAERELASYVPEWPAAAVETLRALLEPPRG